MESSIRRPAVAGRFYPGDRDTLLGEVRTYLAPTEKTTSAIGCVVPHAGYIYSGHVAGALFARLNIPRRCIVLCPNHTGVGQALAIMSGGAWETPLGKVAVDSSLAGALKHRYSLLTEDADAHRAEHAVEVELPFLQAKSPSFTFVPIALGIGKFDVLESLGQAIGDVVKDAPEPVLIIASSDMNHYEDDKITRVKDHKAIEKILAMDARGLFDVVMNEDISMCGFGPTVAMLTAAKRLGATAAELIRYATSGDISGDREMVVGYAGILVR